MERRDTDLAAWWICRPNACLAIVMNVTVCSSGTSAFSFTLAGPVKGAFIVALFASILGETVVCQYMGFFVCPRVFSSCHTT